MVHYAGQSSHGMKRPNDHRRPSNRKNANTSAWLLDLWSSGHDYEIVILQEVPSPKSPGTLCWWWPGLNATALNDAERWWIAYGRASGWPLTNATEGGEGCVGYRPTPEIIEKQRAASQRNKPLAPCGTNAGFRRNRWRKQRALDHCGPCDACVQAYKEHERARTIRESSGLPTGRQPHPCGTEAAYKRAMKQNREGVVSCGPCAECLAAHEKHVAPTRKGPRKLVPCGTNGGFARAQDRVRRGVENCGPCEACVKAHDEYMRDYRANNPPKKPNKP